MMGRTGKTHWFETNLIYVCLGCGRWFAASRGQHLTAPLDLTKQSFGSFQCHMDRLCEELQTKIYYTQDKFSFSFDKLWNICRVLNELFITNNLTYCAPSGIYRFMGLESQTKATFIKLKIETLLFYPNSFCFYHKFELFVSKKHQRIYIYLVNWFSEYFLIIIITFNII